MIEAKTTQSPGSFVAALTRRAEALLLERTGKSDSRWRKSRLLWPLMGPKTEDE